MFRICLSDSMKALISNLDECLPVVASGVSDAWACYSTAWFQFLGIERSKTTTTGTGGFCYGEEAPEITVEGAAGEMMEARYTLRNPTFRTVSFAVEVPDSIASGEQRVPLTEVTVEPENVTLGPRQSTTVVVRAKMEEGLRAGSEYSCDVRSRTKLGRLVLKRTQ